MGDEPKAPPLRVTDKRRFAGPDAPGSEEGPGAPGSDEPSSSSDELAATWSDELVAARAEAKEYLDHLRRLQAEFDNYRKRVLKEQTHAVEHAAEPVVRKLLEVLDDFDLALMSAEAQPDFAKFLKGVELVYAKLADALKAEGLERMDAQGRTFDPEQHEALMQTGDGDGEPVVADVLRPGYTLRGRVLRPAGVRVERS